MIPNETPDDVKNTYVHREVWFEYGAQKLRPHDLRSKLEDARELGLVADLAKLEDLVTHGVLMIDGEPMADLPARRVRSRLLDPDGVFKEWWGRQPGMHMPKGERRWLIPGLWPWGTTPLLTGQPKAGKSTFVAELVAALTIRDRRLLDHFDPVELSLEEAGDCGITLICAEGAPEDTERELARLGVKSDAPDQSLVTLYYLEHEGLSLNLLDPEVYDRWLQLLAVCDYCDGTDDTAPTVIIVDGITAILQTEGLGVEKYGLWIAAFRRLQRELGTPNGLIVGHSTMQGGHSLGNTEGSAQSDGLWSYFMKSPDSPTSKRYFKVIPRLGGVAIPPTRVELGDDGRLRLAQRHVKTEGYKVSDDENAPKMPDYEARVITFVREHRERTGDWPSSTDLRGVQGAKAKVRAARAALVDAGELREVPRLGRGGGVLYALAESLECEDGS